MAEITTASSGEKPGVRRSKKNSTRVDLTPMVDLGFLLITFFVFTTQMAKPTAMKLVMPADGSETKTGRSTALTVIPLSGDRIFYYHGDLSDAATSNLFGITSYSLADGVGAVIRAKQVALDQVKIGRQEMMLIIKPSDESVLSNTVDILDEVEINDLKHYAMDKLSEPERQFLLAKNISL